jgi:hypothetical protein
LPIGLGGDDASRLGQNVVDVEAVLLRCDLSVCVVSSEAEDDRVVT